MTGADPMVRSNSGFTDATSTTTSLFLGGWVLAQFVAVIVLSALGSVDADADRPIAVVGAALVVAWAVEVGACVVASKRAGSGDFRTDLGLFLRPVDLIGIPVGIAAQLVLLRVVYWPLEAIWPDTFDQTKVEEYARDLVDGVGGAELVVLVALVVVGAPLVEEVFYRGLLQRPWLQRFDSEARDSTPAVAVVVVVAIVFAGIHFRPIEFPGLFAFGLVVGALAAVTGRLGMSMVTHVAFNATALALVV